MGKNAYAVDFQIAIEAYQVKVGTYSQINVYMIIYDNPSSSSFIDLCPRLNGELIV